MTDFFALLEQPRRPWLDPAALRDAFHRQSARLHPDVAGTGDAALFQALNTAYETLREPAARLRHLHELVTGAVPAATAPAGPLADLFMEVAGLRRRVSGFVARLAAATSPLARALLAGEQSALAREVEALLSRAGDLEREAAAGLQEMSTRWPDCGVAEIAALQPRFAYLARCLAQLREARLALPG